MGKASYIRKEHIFWIVQCSHIYNGKKYVYEYRSGAGSYTESLEGAKSDCGWSKHPTFEAKVIGIIFS